MSRLICVASVLLFCCTAANAFQLFNGQLTSLNLRERRHVSLAKNQINMAAKGFGSATDKKNQKPVTDALPKANPAVASIPIEPHELPPGSQFMGTIHYLSLEYHINIHSASCRRLDH
jgi:hypothetical protein